MPSRKCWICAESDHSQSPMLRRGVQRQFRNWRVSWILLLLRHRRRTLPQLPLGGWVTNQTEQTPDQVSTNWTCQHLRSAPGRICCAMTSCAGWNSGNICFILKLIINCSTDHRKSIIMIQKMFETSGNSILLYTDYVEVVVVKLAEF